LGKKNLKKKKKKKKPHDSSSSECIIKAVRVGAHGAS
jgi:hypothetical protein